MEDQTPERDRETFAIIGAAMEVHRLPGSGFLEGVYQAALAFEFASRAIPFEREVDIPVFYKGEQLPCGYRADFLCNGSIVVELKAIQRVTTIEHAQIINYLRAIQHKRGLLINFGARSLEHKRFAN